MLRSPHRLRETRATLAVVILAVCAPAALPARDKTWIGADHGNFSLFTNWSPLGAPGSSDRAIFGQATTHTVAFTSDPLNDRLRILNDRVTFSLGGHTYTIGSTGNSSITVGDGASATLSLVNGTLQGVSADLAVGAGITGSVAVSTGATFSNSALLNVGLDGAGALSVINGGHASCAIGTVGYNTTATGTATVSGAGSIWQSTNWLDIGGGGTGTLNIQSGGHVTSPRSSVGAGPGSTATATVNGNGSLLDCTGSLRVGEYGNGTLFVQSGGTVNNHNNSQSPASIIGDQSGSVGTATVDGGSWTNSYALQVGNIGTGHLILENNALATAHPAYIGYSPGGSGSVSVTTNSDWSVSALHLGGSADSPGGTAVLTIDSGGEVTTSGGLVDFYGPATINLGPGGTLTTGMLVNGGGTLNWTGGTIHITNMVLPIGLGGPLGANANIGAGMFLDEYSSIQVASGGNGSLAIGAGGLVRSWDGDVGHDGGPTGTVTVDGQGSNWFMYNPLVVGQNGNATLLIQNQGSVQSEAIAVGEAAGIIGNAATSVGHVVVDGTGSEWGLGPLLGPTYLDVGEYGTGTLTIQNGGMVVDVYGGGTIGAYAGSNGTATITGQDSTWILDAYGLAVGWHGTGTLNVLNGGTVIGGQFAADTVLGQETGAHGTASVDGAGSLLAAGDLTVGDGGTGALSVTGGGTVTAFDAYLGAFPGANGTVVVDGAASSLAINGSQGTLGVGSANTGALTVSNGGHVQAKETFIGDGLQAAGTALVTGTGSLLDSVEELHVGYLGAGTLTVEAGGAVSTPVGGVGFHGNSTGTATVDGADSAWTVTDHLDVGGAASGSLTVQNGGAVQVTNVLNVWNNGRLALEDGSVAAALVGVNGGLLEGGGTVSAALSNNGTVAPDGSAAIITVSGTYSQMATGALDIDLDGASPGTGYSQLAISGAASLAGTLNVTLSPDFHPAAGQTFTILTSASISGTFASVVATPPTLDMSVIYNPSSVVLQVAGAPLRGDLNCDGVVNNFDITPFVKALTATPPDYPEYYALYPDCDRDLGDINGDGLVNNFDITPFVHLLTGG